MTGRESNRDLKNGRRLSNVNILVGNQESSPQSTFIVARNQPAMYEDSEGTCQVM